MRIGFVTDSYPTTCGSGGIGTYTRSLARHLASRDHDVTVFTFANSEETADDDGVTVCSFPPWTRRKEMPLARSLEFTLRHRNQAWHLNGFQLKSAIRGYVRRRGRFHVIEVPEFAGIGAWISGERVLSDHVSVRLHGSRPDVEATAIEKDLERRAIIRADSRTSSSRAALDRARQVLALDFNAVVIPNPIDRRPISPLAGRDGPQVFFCGRLTPEKGIDILISALELVPDVRAAFAGMDFPWAEAGRTTAQVIAKSNANIELLGVVPHARAIEIAASARLVVAPSRLEAFSLSVAEAMAAGTPVVCSDIAAFREQTDYGRGARLSEPTPEAFAVNIKELLNDAELAQKLGRAAYERAQQWAVERVTDKLLTVWT